jgi:outer membrane protein assembly factor BamD
MRPTEPLFRSRLLIVTASFLSVNLLCGFGLFHKKKYETPITKETMQPDKVLFDRAVNNVEHGNYLAARLTLNTLINTYDTSEYLAKAKLLIADSWFREGDAHGLAQAEIEYKDFILFYPNMEEAAESQSKVCDIHIKQMSDADRDSSQAQRAEDECRTLLTQFPNSKYVKGVEQKLRDVQEMLAEKEYETGLGYFKKGALPAAEGRFAYVAQQYPLFSAVDEALWDEADAFHKMGDRFENQEADALTKIVRDYPVSLHVAAAKSRLTEMKRPVPDANPDAYARMKYNMEHRTHEGILSRAMGIVSGRPDMGAAAKEGAPVMTEARPPVPVSVPMDAATTAAPGSGATGGGASDVGIGVATNSSALDQKNDARISAPATDGEHKASVGSTGISTDPAAVPPIQGPLPTNRTKKELDDYKKRVDAAAALQKKAYDAMVKRCAKTPTATGCNVAPAPAAPPAPGTVVPGAAPGATVPAATPPGAASPATVPPAVKQ